MTSGVEERCRDRGGSGAALVDGGRVADLAHRRECGPELVPVDVGLHHQQVPDRVVDEVGRQVGQDRPARGAGVQGVLRSDLDDHLHLLRTLELIEVDAAVPHEDRQRGRLAGLVAQPLQDRCRDPAYVELAPGLGTEADGRRPQGVRRVPGHGLDQGTRGERLEDAVHDRLAEADLTGELGDAEWPVGAGERQQDVGDPVRGLGARHHVAHLRTVSNGFHRDRLSVNCSAERTPDLAQIYGQPL